MLYETDFYSWTQQQADLLRDGRLAELDVEHLLEEVLDMASNKRRELKSRLVVLITHLLKWQYQSSYRGRSWTLTIISQRLEIADLLDENPGLKAEVTGLLNKAYKLAKLQAERETGLALKTFPDVCPWDFEQLVDDGFLPD